MVNLLFIYLFIPLLSLQADLDSLQVALDNKKVYETSKLRRLDSIKSVGNNMAIARAYNSYCYDSALVYAQKAFEDGKQSGDAARIFDNYIRLASVYMSGGRFVECTELFDSMCLTGIDARRLSTYYSQRGRLLYNIARYQNSPYSPQMRNYYERALTLWQGDSINNWNLKAQLAICDGDLDSACKYTQQALEASYQWPHSQAIFSSALAQIYLDKGDSAQALHYWLCASIRDLEAATKEVIAMQEVAQLLFSLGENDLANRCIRSALADAQLQGARHRQLEVGEILPIIDQYQITQLNIRNNKERTLYICIVLLLFVGGIALGWLYYRLRGLNKLQETYLATMLALEADHTESLEHYQKYVMRCARKGDINELLKTPNFLKQVGKRTQFYKRFDTMFIRLYPHFIERVNEYLTEPFVYENDTLPCELRVFALMRLGILDNSQMSRILSYSVSTIHTYKARVYSMLKCDKNKFLRMICGRSRKSEKE